ncbi:MAG: hypothetical protein PHT07_00030 [Paludibacter sp.]|nr:hypothetical protein [Paludibacter sp.]
MKLSTRFLIAFSFFTILLNAQTGFRPGYVIKEQGDTLFGQVDFQSERRMGEKCTFRQNDTASVVTFSPGEIVGYRFVEGKYYVSRVLKGNKVFLEFLIKGRVDIYFRTDKYSDHYYIENDSLGIAELQYSETYKRIGEMEYLDKSTRHFGLLNYYMKDAPGLRTEILKVKKPERKNLIALAKDYHNVVCDGEKCIIYENKPPLIKVNLEVLCGVFNVPSYKNAVQPLFLKAGAIAHIWAPSVSENCFINLGIISVKTPDLLSNELPPFSVFFPVQLEYIFPSKYVQPKIGIGTVSFPFLIPNYMIGANVKLSKKYFLSFNYEAIFSSDYIIIPQKIIAHSLTAGFNVAL